MRMFALGGLGVLLLLGGDAAKVSVKTADQPHASTVLAIKGPGGTVGRVAENSANIAPEILTAVVQRYCVICHNDALKTGNMSLQGLDVANPMARAETAEKMIQRLRMGMMPPPGIPRPGGDTLQALYEELENRLDRAAAASPNPGSRSFQRLNRVEYENSVKELLGIEVHAEAYLPPDTKSNNFDNIVDVQLMSPTLMDGILRGASEISRLAVGDPQATPKESLYWVVREASQSERVEGAPFGSRGGTSVLHTFPADGQYYFRVGVYNGGTSHHTAENPEQLEFSIDGERVALLDTEGLGELDPVRTESVFIRSGQHRVTAAFIKRYEGPDPDLLKPLDYTGSQSGGYGVQYLPHLRDLAIVGPYNTSGVSETATRRKIFSCRPTSPAEARPCALQILSRLATDAYRRPVKEEEVKDLMTLYDEGAREGGFENGVRSGLELILASPHFLFRIERSPANVRPGQSYPIGDFDLASRLSYFLWAAPPDQELIVLAKQGKLSDRRVLEAQARRMLADPRSEALATRFLAQWLRLQDVDKVIPDVDLYPDFHTQLGTAMRRETELFFYYLVKNDLSVLDLFTADYTFANERLAKHYGIPGVVGEEFRKVQYPDATRRGLFGHGSVLMLTSVAARTSPVLRGKWVMEVILGTPPPPPPPGVPALEATQGSTTEGRILTTRERMEVHRAAPVCRACHNFMDPIGLALDNFDVVGKWRIRENGMPLDTRGELYDGTPVTNPKELQDALMKRPVPILRNFTSNLMSYALGRVIEYYDMPAIRKIVKDAEANQFHMSSFVLGVVMSDAFRMQEPQVVTTAENNQQK